MSTRPTRILAPLLAALLASACVGNVREEVASTAIDAQKGPEAPVQRNITNFDDALLCMDMLMIDNGIRDVVVLTEDLVDNTKKANVGTRDMMISAVSDMTRRSRAIRLITFGGDVKNLQDWLKNSGGHTNVYNFQPDYNIRGSLTQMDEGIASGQAGLNVQLGPIGGGKNAQANATVVGLDLSVMSTKTMELLPGVTSKNSVMLIRSGEGTNFGINYQAGGQQQQQQQPQQQQGQPAPGGMQGQVNNRTFGINYNFSVAKSEGVGGGVRNLIELATIELFGKLLRVPYWQCLGVDARHPVVKREIGDWYYNLVSEGKLVAYMQNQLRVMGRYNGPINGQMNKELREVLRDLAAANRMPMPEVIDESLFSYVLNLRNKNIRGSATQLAHLSPEDLKKRFARKKGDVLTRGLGDTGKDGGLQPIALKMVGERSAFRPGDPLRLSVVSDRDAFLYCYLAGSKDTTTMRIFPNPKTSDPLVRAKEAVMVPGGGTMAVKIPAGADSVVCFASDTDPVLSVGQNNIGNGFEQQQKPLDAIRTAIGSGAEVYFGEGRLNLRKR